MKGRYLAREFHAYPFIRMAIFAKQALAKMVEEDITGKYIQWCGVDIHEAKSEKHELSVI